jgi:hypothetical protein
VRSRALRLPPEAALITPRDLLAFLVNAGWSGRAARWLAEETTLKAAVIHIAVGERQAPSEIVERVIAWKIAEQARVDAQEPSPKPPNTKRSRRP